MARHCELYADDLVAGRDLDPDGVPTFYLVNRMLAYDPDTGFLTWKVNRTSWPKGARAGTQMITGYRRIILFARQYAEHRVAWLLSYGHWPEMGIDHANRDKADNRLVNLRLATHAENMRNAGHKGSKSGHRGVKYCPNDRRWIARIQHDGKRVSLGYYDTAEEAAAAYRAAATAARGEFLCLHAKTSDRLTARVSGQGRARP